MTTHVASSFPASGSHRRIVRYSPPLARRPSGRKAIDIAGWKWPASELCSVKPQIAPMIAASTVIRAITGSR